MKMIHGLILALTLSVTFSLAAQDTAAPAPKSKSSAKKVKKTAKPVVATSADATSEKSTTVVFINPPQTAVVTHDKVNVRGRASFVGEVITSLRKGESVTLLEEITLGKTTKNEPANWFRIAMPASTPVWVSAHFIDATSKTVKARKLQVRAGPGENFSVVGDLEKGESVKIIRTVGDWIEIEPPVDTFAFVAAELIDRTPVTPAPVPVVTPVPEPAPEVVQVPTAPENPAPAEPLPPTVTEPPVAPPVVVPEPAVAEPLPKRIVTREGIIRRSLNVQTPSYYELESIETGKIINYLYSSQPGFTLKTWIGSQVMVTGEEIIDKRWRNTPVIEIEKLQTP